MIAIDWIERLLNTVADRGQELLGLGDETAGTRSDADLCARLVRGRGEATNIAFAREILKRYSAKSAEQKQAFFTMLAANFDPDHDRVAKAVAEYDPQQPRTLYALASAVEPPRQELMRRLNMAPDGTAALVSMRADLLQLRDDLPELRRVDADFRHLLQAWFNRGFLTLSRIDWHTSASLLEKLIHYESVHPMDGWPDLRRRLEFDRRCFAFFHPALPADPLIFVEVAFTKGIATQISPLIDPDEPLGNPEGADTAMFYSINNALVGLRGISFGNFLIKQVVGELASECPGIKTYATISPIPRMRAGLRAVLDGHVADQDENSLEAGLGEYAAELRQRSGETDPLNALDVLMQDIDGNRKLLDGVLRRLAIYYLTVIKRGAQPYDPVAGFHLANGALLERVNVFANRSERSVKESWGVMANYRYDIDQVVSNHEAFIAEGRIVTSRPVRKVHDAIVADLPAVD